MTSFVALGDSFTEGLNDFRPDGSLAGWADRLATIIDGEQPGLRYANVAIRGRLLDQIVDEQIPIALANAPDLVGFSAGGNDLLRVGSDPDGVASRYEAAVTQLRESGSRVMVFTGYDVGDTPVLRLARGRIAIYNEHLRGIAARHGCDLVDLWSLGPLRDRRAYSEDRLHLSSDGHERVARLAGQVLGFAVDDPEEPWLGPGALSTRRDDLVWARDHLVPWVRRRIRHESTGDAVTPKRPRLDSVDG